MTDINVEFINPFLIATVGILRDMCQMELKVEKPYIKTTEFADDSILIMIGLTGEMRGQVIIALTINGYKDHGINSKIFQELCEFVSFSSNIPIEKYPPWHKIIVTFRSPLS